jgi:hypothetical protein
MEGTNGMRKELDRGKALETKNTEEPDRLERYANLFSYANMTPME